MIFFFLTRGPTLSFCTEPANYIVGPAGVFEDFWILRQDSDWAGLVWALDSVLLTASLICNLPALKFTRFKSIIQCILSIARVLQSSPLSHSRKFSCPPKTPHFPSPQPPGNLDLCRSVLVFSVRFRIRQYVSIFAFIQHHVFKVNPCRSLCHCLFLFTLEHYGISMFYTSRQGLR